MYPGEHAKMQRTLILDIHIHSPKSIQEKEIIMLKKNMGCIYGVSKICFGFFCTASLKT